MMIVMINETHTKEKERERKITTQRQGMMAYQISHVIGSATNLAERRGDVGRKETTLEERYAQC